MTNVTNPPVRAAIVSVGSEVVRGDQVDTNAAWLATRLRGLGVDPRLIVAVSDDIDELVDGLHVAIDRADIVVVGGGLGPTSDDRTREAVARTAGLALERRPVLVAAIEERFQILDRPMPVMNLRQADVPAGAVAMPPAGTAPGFSLTIDGTDIHVLPGVPWELRQLFDRHVAPAVASRAGGRVLLTRIVHVAGRGESDVADMLATVEDGARADGIEVGYLATTRGLQVKFSGAGHDREKVAMATDCWVRATLEVLGSSVVGLDADTIEATVVAGLAAADRTLAVAESATGGLVMARLTQVPGASAVVRGGMVVYATDTKVSLAGIDPALLDKHPPVSEPVTRALAIAVRDRFGADIGVATTAVAGPDTQDGVPVGTAIWAVADFDGAKVWSRHLRGDRGTIRDILATAAIDAVRRHLG